MTEKDVIEDVCKTRNTDYRNLDCDDWLFYLTEKFTFPFKSEVDLYSYSEVLKDGDIISVKSLDDCFDMYGIIATVRLSRRKYNVPLVEMEVLDKKSKNYVLLEAYKTWFSN